MTKFNKINLDVIRSSIQLTKNYLSFSDSDLLSAYLGIIFNSIFVLHMLFLNLLKANIVKYIIDPIKSAKNTVYTAINSVSNFLKYLRALSIH